MVHSADADGHLTATPDEVRQLLTEIMAGVPPASSDAWNADHTTKFTALEILLPHHERNNVEAEIRLGKTTMDIAKKYRIPHVWVDLYLTSTYKSLMDACYAAAGF